MLTVAAGKDAGYPGHLGVRVGDREAALALDRTALQQCNVGALAGREQHLIGLQGQQSAGVELRVEATAVVLDPLAELKHRRALGVDAQRTPTGMQLHALGHGQLDLVGAGRHLAALSTETRSTCCAP